MKKRSIILHAILFFVPLYCASDQEEAGRFDQKKRVCALQSTFFESHLFHADGTPKSELSDLLGTLNVPHDGSRQSVIKGTQGKFLKRGIECHEIKEDSAYSSKTLKPCFERLGMLQEIAPQEKKYDGCVVLDAHYLDWYRERLAYLHVLGDRGVGLKKLYVCAGNHEVAPLYSKKDFFEYDSLLLPLGKHYNCVLEKPKTEIEMINILLFQVKWREPVATLIKQKELVYTEIDEQTGRRPSTRTNVQDFLAKKPQDGKYLVVTNQPHVGYQHAVFLTSLLESSRRNIIFETVGSQNTGSLNNAQELDRLTRWIYQEGVLLDKMLSE